MNVKIKQNTTYKKADVKKITALPHITKKKAAPFLRQPFLVVNG